MPETIAWVYNTYDGTIVPLPTAAAVIAVKTLNWKGPFKTEQAVRDFYEKNKAANPSWKAPTKDPTKVAGNTADAIKDDLTPDLPSLSNADIQSWLLRIGEILLGIVLLGVGVAKLTGTPNVVSKAVRMK